MKIVNGRLVPSEYITDNPEVNYMEELCKKTKTAYIEVARREIIPFGFYNTYRWIGNKKFPVKITGYFNHDANISKLPWKLKRIDYDLSRDEYTYIRQDSFFAWFYWLKVKWLKVWLWFYCRFIITLNVWGLAYTHAGNIPSWRDIGKKK